MQEMLFAFRNRAVVGRSVVYAVIPSEHPFYKRMKLSNEESAKIFRLVCRMCHS